jgi:hypothetical protein
VPSGAKDGEVPAVDGAGGSATGNFPAGERDSGLSSAYSLTARLLFIAA